MTNPVLQQIEAVRQALHDRVVLRKPLDTYALAIEVIALCDSVIALTEQMRGHDHLTLDGSAQVPEPAPTPPNPQTGEDGFRRAQDLAGQLEAAEQHVRILREQPQSHQPPGPSAAVLELTWARFLVEHSSGGRSDVLKAIDERIAMKRIQPPTQEIQRMEINAEIGLQVRHIHTGTQGRVIGIFRDRNGVDSFLVESVDATRRVSEDWFPAGECGTDLVAAGPTETK